MNNISNFFFLIFLGKPIVINTSLKYFLSDQWRISMADTYKACVLMLDTDMYFPYNILKYHI